MSRIHFLGGCKTIGRSAFLIEESKSMVLLDYGASFNGHPSFPPLTRPYNLAVALSHAHLDHSGGLPLLFAGGSAPVYMTAITRDLIGLLLRDMIRLSEYFLPFEEYELNRLLRRITVVEYEEPIEVGNGITLTFYDAGHIPGSAAILVKTANHQIMYTGDINTIDTQLQYGASIPLDAPDTVIIESTYALRNHDPRLDIEHAFIDTVTEVVDDGGVVLVPAFAVARAQEILCILEDHQLSYPRYMDGMARKASRIFLRNEAFFRDYSLLQKALQNTQWINHKKQRETVMNAPGIMVAPAGMLRGGTATHYLSQIMDNPKNAVILVGYQIPGTPGHELLEKGTFDNGNGPQRVKARVHYYDFSSHAGQDQLLALGSSFSNAKQLYTVHGEADACQFLATELRENHGINAHVAESGQKIEL